LCPVIVRHTVSKQQGDAQSLGNASFDHVTVKVTARTAFCRFPHGFFLFWAYLTAVLVEAGSVAGSDATDAMLFLMNTACDAAADINLQGAYRTAP
jgi:hypothetical protein